MTEFVDDRGRFSCVELDLPVTIQQGGMVWRERLVNLSLVSVATTVPQDWDAQYNQAFTLEVTLPDGGILELHAYLQQVHDDSLQFAVQHVDRENIDPLRELLAAHFEDPAALDEEVSRLD